MKIGILPSGGDFLVTEDGMTFPLDMTTEDETTFPAGSSTTQVSLSTVDDSTHEADGTVTLTVLDDHFKDGSYSTGDAEDGQPEFATLKIRNNDNAPPTGVPTIDNTTPMAGDTLTANASGISDQDGLTVTDATFTWQWIRVASDNTETPITGATAAAYTVGAGDVGATLKVKATFTDDDGTEETVESAETSAVQAASVTLPTVTVTRVPTPVRVEEGEGAQFTVTRTVVTTGALTVAYRVSESGDMVAPSDEGAQKTVDFADGDTQQTVTVPTVEDSVHEADSTVTVMLTADTGADPTYLLGEPSTATAEVEDDDNAAPTGTPTIDDTTPVVGETLMADASNLDDPDGLTDRSSFTWQWLRVASGGGTPTEITGATTATYTVAAGDVGATLKVRAGFTDDDGTGETVESAETATVTEYTITAASPTVTEGDDAGFTSLQFALTRSDTGQSVELGWRVAAESTAQVSVPTTGDSAHEAHGSVTLTLTLTPDTGADPAYLLGDPATATAAVRDDDDSPATGSVTVTTATTFTEGETLTADTSGLTDGDGLDNASYAYQWVRTPSGGGDADISGETSQTYVPVFADAGATLKVRVTVTDDEGHQATFTSAPTSAVAALPRPSVTVVSAGDITEGSPAVFTLTRTGDLAQTLDVAYAVTASGDFGAATGASTATFLANNATVQVSVDTTDDSTHETNGSATVTLTADTGADPAYLLGDPATATAAVEDDDDSPATGSVTITGTPTEGETLTADTSGLTDADGLDKAAYVYQWVRTPSGGSDADISGETGATYTPVFADVGATLKVKVTVTDNEGHEAMFESTPTSAVEAAAPTLPEVSIMQGDGGSPITEGGRATFTLTISKPPTALLFVNIRIMETGDMMTENNLGETVTTFGPNQKTTTLSYPTVDDAADEPNSTVTVEVLERENGNYMPGTPSMASVVVQDDDGPATPTLPELSIAGASVGEGDSGSTTLDFTVTLDSAATATVTVEWATSDGTATAGADYTAGNGTLTFNSEGGWTLTPSFGLGVRHDGGDAETGFGVDVGAGVAYADPSSGVTVDLRGRGLLAHEASGFREAGFSGSLAFDPSPSSDRGLSVTLGQTLGASATGGVEALYGRDTMAGLGGADAGAGAVDSQGRRRLEARVGYGVATFGGRFTGTPELGFGVSESGRDYRLGWRLTPAGGNTAGANAGSFELHLEATRREAATGDGRPEYGVGVRATVRW